jgi:glycosyltransferase involved in cell wall biosynthesis
VLRVLQADGFFDGEHKLIVSALNGRASAKVVRMIFALGSLAWWIGVRRVGLVHLHVAAFNSFWRKSIFLLLAKCLGARVVLHWHSPRLKQFIDLNRGSTHSLIRRVFLSADVVIAASFASRQELIDVFPTLDPVVVYNPVDDRINAVPEESIRRNNDILYMAALLREKGVFELVDAFAEVRNVCRDARLTICGSGLDQELHEHIVSLGLQSEIRMPGWVVEDERSRYFGEAALFCLPSRADTFAMANLDAMAAGLPVVSTTYGGIPEVVQDGVTGLLAAPGDAQDLIEKLVRLISDPELRVRMGRAGRRVAREQFSAKRMMAELERIYKDLR